MNKQSWQELVPADKRPLCPECGYPAWYVLAPVIARFELDLEGIARVAQDVVPAAHIKPGPDDLYECGGRHTRRVGTPT